MTRGKIYSFRAIEDEKKARLGVGECVNHELMVPYPVLFEKDGTLLSVLSRDS